MNDPNTRRRSLSGAQLFIGLTVGRIDQWAVVGVSR
jgi:hypothetical protein